MRPYENSRQRRTVSLMLRCTPAEAEVIKATADAEGLPIAIFLRQGGLGQIALLTLLGNQDLIRIVCLIISALLHFFLT